ncbi:MAG TPA: hypothetical protein VLC09_05765, partial [Polyangiaceae bacterium]|nr:hypothetical protein [Polyangiaceae bacterium]
IEQGRRLFLSAEVGCAECHPPENGYTLRRTFPLPALPTRPGFDPETELEFKIPALTFLAERAPYFHDGSAESLEALLEHNADRMGKTSQLSVEQRAALVEFLRTL